MFISQLRNLSLHSLKIYRGELALKKYFKLNIYNKRKLCNIKKKYNFYFINFLEFENA